MARIAILGIPEFTYTLKNIYGIDIYFVYGLIAFFILILNVIVLSNARRNITTSFKDDIDSLKGSYYVIGSITYNSQPSIRNHTPSDYIQLKDLSEYSIIN